MSNKKPVESLIGTVIFGVITAFFVLMAVAPQGPGDALQLFFAFIFGSLSGVVFLVFFLFWAVKKRKYEKEKSHREMMARRRVERWRRE